MSGIQQAGADIERMDASITKAQGTIAKSREAMTKASSSLDKFGSKIPKPPLSQESNYVAPGSVPSAEQLLDRPISRALAQTERKILIYGGLGVALLLTALAIKKFFF